MDPKRQYEIAVLLVKEILRKRGIRLSKEIVRDLGNVAQKIGRNTEELKIFFEPLIREMVNEMFSSPNPEKVEDSMDPKRRGEIAILFVKETLRKENFRLSRETMRELGNVAKKIGVSTEELKTFFEPLVREMVNEMFSSFPLSQNLKIR